MEELLKLAEHHQVIRVMLEDGKSLPQMIIELIRINQALIADLATCSAICPKAYVVGNKKMVWHCPDELVPVTPSITL